MKSSVNKIISLIFLILGLIGVSHANQGKDVLIVHKSKVWQVSKEGRMAALPYEFANGNDVDHQGTTSAVLSPDQSMIAYTQNNDLWLLNLKDKKMERLTRHGRELSSNATAVYVLISAWSTDNRKVLYYVAHSEQQDVDGGPDLEIPSAAYGYREYDLETRASKPVKLPGEFEAWLPNGDFLLTSAESDLFDQHLLLFKASEELPQLASPLKGWWGQSSISPSGRNILIAFSEATPPSALKSVDEHELNDDPRLSSRIMKLDLRTKKLTNVSPLGSWSEYQMPAYSPTGKRIAYIRQEEQDSSGYIRGKLIVDGKAVTSFSGLPFEYYWIDDDAVALVEDATLVVVDPNNGREIWHGSFEPTEPKLSSTRQ